MKFPIALAMGLLAVACTPDLNPGNRPNIVLIMSDDQGWGDLSLHGNTNIQTPNIDRLAYQGAQFRRFYVAPLCAPTRAGLLTGRYHLRTNVIGVMELEKGQYDLRLMARTITEEGMMDINSLSMELL